MLKVLLIGSSGFVGKHIVEVLTTSFELFTTTRDRDEKVANCLYFDFTKSGSWHGIIQLNPDVIINCGGYSAVNHQDDLEALYDVNYRLPCELIKLLQNHNLQPFWLQIGSAFEYDLGAVSLTEASPCVPMTHYGISKFLCSNFLLSANNTLPFLILRPFAMYGPYDTASKFLPHLILAQRDGNIVSLSSGEQKRDYFYVKDFANLIKSILLKGSFFNLKAKIINVGSGTSRSLKDIATELSSFIPNFQPHLWGWGQLPQRNNENSDFFNSSLLAREYGFQETNLDQAYNDLISYYYSNAQCN